MIPPPGTERTKLVATSVGLSVGALVYAQALLNWTTSLTRTALATHYFSGFYDLQARRLLAGHVDVPTGSLGIEGFVHDGKTFMYFPPWPALLRLPVLLTTHEYDGRLTVLSMALAWVVFAVMVTKLVWWLVPRLGGDPGEGAAGTVGPVTPMSGALVAAFIAAATGGSFLTFDASEPWVYHEAYVWAVASVTGGIYWLVRLLFEPTRHASWWLFVFGLLSVGSRATEGWALCVVVIAVGLWLRRARDPLWWRVLLAGVVPLALSIALNEYKFGTVYSFPLQDQVWTQLNAHRRAALAANGGGLTGPQFFTTSVMAYLRPDGIRFVDYFPFITLPAHPAPAYDGAYVDQTYRTGSATSFMPLLMLMFCVAAVAVVVPRGRRALKLLRAPLLVSVLVTGGVMDYGYYSARYASEFVPALVVGGAITTALLCGWTARHTAWRVPAVAVLTLGATFSMVAQLAIGLTMSAYIQRGGQLERYVQWQHDVSPRQQAGLVSRVTSLPTGGSTDDLAILGDCQTLYVNTGDRYEPWLPVQDRDRVLQLSPVGRLRPGSVTLLRVSGNEQETVSIQVDGRSLVRFVTRNGTATARGPWFDVPTSGGIRLGVRNLIALGYFQFQSTPGGLAGYLPSVYFDHQWNSVPALLTIESPDAALARLGLRMAEHAGLPLPLCTEIARSAGIRFGG